MAKARALVELAPSGHSRRTAGLLDAKYSLVHIDSKRRGLCMAYIPCGKNHKDQQTGAQIRVDGTGLHYTADIS